MNDDIEKINERNRELNDETSPGDQSQARFSKITHPDEDKQKIAQGIIAELGQHREELDSIKEAIKLMGDQINALTGAINQMVKGGVLSGNTGVPGSSLNMETVSAIGELLEKGAQAYKNFKGGDSAVVDSFTQTIVDRSKQEAMQSLDIVSLINQKVKKTLVNDIAGDLAGHIIKDSSDTSNEHAPK